MSDLTKNCKYCQAENLECECKYCEACDSIILDPQEDGSGDICRKCEDQMKDFGNWERTGEIIDEIDCYDWSEEALFYSDNGSEYIAIAVISCDKIIEIEDIELVEDINGDEQSK